MKLSFEDCELDLERHELRRAGKLVEVEPQVFDLLKFLAQNSGKLVSKDELVDAIWQGRAIPDSAITARVASARKAVGDDGKAQAIIRTVPRRGLEFVAQISSDDLTIAAPRTIRRKMRFATACDGEQLAYTVSGEGPPLILSAHFPSQTDDDTAVSTDREALSILESRYTLLRYDHRGSGLSTMRLSDPVFSTWVDDLRTIADAVGFRKFALLGRSSGSMHAIEFAARHPNRVSHLILEGGYAEGRLKRQEANPTDEDTIVKMIKEGWQTNQDAFFSAYINAYFPDAPPQFAREAASKVRNSAPLENVLTFRAATNWHSVVELLPKIQIPTLILHSRNDAVHPLSEAQKLAAGLPNAELMIFNSANHWTLPSDAHWQDWQDTVFEFLDRRVG